MRIYAPSIDKNYGAFRSVCRGDAGEREEPFILVNRPEKNEIWEMMTGDPENFGFPDSAVVSAASGCRPVGVPQAAACDLVTMSDSRFNFGIL
jgi:hypothetical protein